MRQLLGRSSSINVRKVLWTCHELGLPFEHIEWGLPDRPLSSPEFRRLNPNGLVPVLVEGSGPQAFVLTESNTICRYLASGVPGQTLLPAEPRARAQVERWMDWQATELNNAWRTAFMGLVRRSPEHADPAAIAASVVRWHHYMGVLEGALQASGGPWITGETFTLADIVLGVATHRWRASPIERPSLPAVERFYAALAARPAFVAAGIGAHP